LPDTISAWTLSLPVAKTFKGGVPPEGWQGVIFEIVPGADSVILNLNSLYGCPEFRKAMAREAGTIEGYADGAGRHQNDQAEVVLSIEKLDCNNVYALGGYSSDRDTLIKMIFKQDPTPASIKWFEQQQKRAEIALGPFWLDGPPLQRVLKRMQPHVNRLKPIKAAQRRSPSACRSSK
jgi:hypothetical protein